MSKLVKIDDDVLVFDTGHKLYSEHEVNCCESHFLNFDDLSLSDFEGLEFDLTGESFFKRVDGYGIELIPLVGHPLRIAGHGYNNGYYSSDLSLVLERPKVVFDISECQEIE